MEHIQQIDAEIDDELVLDHVNFVLIEISVLLVFHAIKTS